MSILEAPVTNTLSEIPTKIEEYTPKKYALQIFKERYAISPEESFEEACHRVSNFVATAEHSNKQKEIAEKFYAELRSNRFCPGGRIWYGSGRPKGQLLNCFVLPTEDSREGWGKTVSDAIVVSSTGGGIGINFSPIRPRHTPISGHSSPATGAISLMNIINAAGDEVRGGGGRRIACMFCLDSSHPDLHEFIREKLDHSKLNNANISIMFSKESPEEFFKKVDNDELHNFMWKDRVVGQIPARELWKEIVNHAVTVGDPGILNLNYAEKMSNIHYYAPLISTNPCGEQWLEAYGSCDLGAIILSRFVENGTFMWWKLAKTIDIAVRFLDNVLDVTSYPLKEIETNCKKVRRLGLGIAGLHDCLILQKKKYTSKEGKEFIGSVLPFIRDRAYLASIQLASEKGSFPALQRVEYLDGGFIQTLPLNLRDKISQYGIRNSFLLTIAPTGTTSIVSECSSGIEPIYALAYKRRHCKGDGIEENLMENPLWEKLKHTEYAPYFETALEISPEDHAEVQVICQQYVDNSISKTINLPSNYKAEDLDQMLRKYLPKLKGLTVYRDGAKGQSPLEPITMEEAMNLNCKNGSCSL